MDSWAHRVSYHMDLTLTVEKSAAHILNTHASRLNSDHIRAHEKDVNSSTVPEKI